MNWPNTKSYLKHCDIAFAIYLISVLLECALCRQQRCLQCQMLDSCDKEPFIDLLYSSMHRSPLFGTLPRF